MRYLIGLDIGTSAIKVGLFDERGQRIGVETEGYELLTPAPDWVEVPAEVYWESFKKSLGRLLDKGGVSNEDIIAIGFSAASETFFCIDKDGHALRNSIVWLDNRATAEAEELSKVITNEELYHVTGQPEMQGVWPASKILWLRNHEPEVFKKTACFLLLEDYFIFRLTGKCCGEGSLWSTSLMIDIQKNSYWAKMLDILGITEEQLPCLSESGTSVGKILPEMAASLHLSEETEVILGGQDQICGSVGAGNVCEGIFTESTGTALASCMTLDELAFDPEEKMPVYRSCLPGKYFISAFGSGGASYRWLKDVLYGSAAANEAGDIYEQMNDEALQAPAGCDGLLVLPHFQGAQAPDADPYAKCSLIGLTLAHSRAHLTRGFLEGVALVLNRMVESCEDMGHPVKEIRSISGGAKSKEWCQIKADICGKKVVTMNTVTDAACLGAAILAGVGTGIWKTPAEAVEAMVYQTAEYEPREENFEIYSDLKRRYRLAMDSMRPLYAAWKND